MSDLSGHYSALTEALKVQARGEYETLRKDVEAAGLRAREAIGAFHATSSKRLDAIEKKVEGLSESIKQNAPSIGAELEARLRALEDIRAGLSQEQETPTQIRQRKIIEEGLDVLDKEAMGSDGDSFSKLHDWVFKYASYVQERMPGVDVRTGTVQQQAEQIIDAIEAIRRADRRRAGA